MKMASRLVWVKGDIKIIKHPKSNGATKSAIAVKAAGYPSIRAAYRRVIDEKLIDFGTSEKGTRVTAYQNAIRTAMVEAFNAAFDAGYAESSGAPRADADDEDAMYWIMERVNEEYGYIGTMMQSLKQLRDQVWAKEAKVGDVNDFVKARNDGYSSSLDTVNATGKLYGKKRMMLTMVGEDGAESCTDCVKRKGKRYSARKWLAIGFPPSRDFECHGYNCAHFLQDDQGNQVTP